MSLRTSLARFIVPLTCLALFVPTLAFAVTDASTGLSATGRVTGLSNGCAGTSASQCIATMVGRALNVIFGFLGVVLLGYVLYGGFMWMTAAGSKEVGEAREVITRAIIGLGIIVSSFAISSFVVTQLGNVTSGSGGSSAGSNATGGAPSVSDIQQGGRLTCCYDTAAALENCTNACTTTPASFGLTATSVGLPSLCSGVCQASRICSGAGNTPIAGQSACSRAGLPPAGIGGGVSAFTLDGYCATQRAAAPSDRCEMCVQNCTIHRMCTPGDPIAVTAPITSLPEAGTVRAGCYTTCACS